MSFIEELSNAASSYRKEVEENERKKINNFINRHVSEMKEKIKYKAERNEFRFVDGKRVIEGTYIFAEKGERCYSGPEYSPYFSLQKIPLIGYFGKLDETFYDTYEVLKNTLSKEGVIISDIYVKAYDSKKITKSEPYFLGRGDHYKFNLMSKIATINGFVRCDYRVEY